MSRQTRHNRKSSNAVAGILEASSSLTVDESDPGLCLFLRRYVAGIKRPFSVRFDPYTTSIEVLDNPLKIQGGLEGVKDELKVLADALSVLS